MYKPSSCNQILNEGIFPFSACITTAQKSTQQSLATVSRTGNVFAKKQVKTDMACNTAFVWYRPGKPVER